MTPRAAAKLAGESRYSTGKPCKNGHMALRITSNAQCTECIRLAIHLWNSRNKQRMKLRSDAWRKANPERCRAYQRKHSEKKSQRAWRRQGLPRPLRPRASHCEICGEAPTKKALALDHCHKTGIFRGWLCGRCNTAIGLFRDNPRALLLAFRYLASAYELPFAILETPDRGPADIKEAVPFQ